MTEVATRWQLTPEKVEELSERRAELLPVVEKLGSLTSRLGGARVFQQLSLCTVGSSRAVGMETGPLGLAVSVRCAQRARAATCTFSGV